MIMGLIDKVNIEVNGSGDLLSTLSTYTTKILKPNIIDGKNILTQAMISSKNTKYVIKYDFVLGEDITVPENCVLEFDGGSLNGNGKITSFVKIIGDCDLSIFDYAGIYSGGKISKIVATSQFKSGTDTERLQNAIDFAKRNSYSLQIDEMLHIDEKVYIEGHLKVFSDSWNYVGIYLDSKDAAVVIGKKDESENYVYEVDFDNVQVLGQDIADYCIIINYASQCRFRRCYCDHALVANYRIYKASINWFDQCYSYYAPIAFNIDNSGNNSFSALNVWEVGVLCHFNGNIAQLNFDRSWIEKSVEIFTCEDNAYARINFTNTYFLSSCRPMYEGSANIKARLFVCISQCTFHVPTSDKNYLIKAGINDTVKMFITMSQIYYPSLANIINNDDITERGKIVLSYDETNTGVVLTNNLLSKNKYGVIVGFVSMGEKTYGMISKFVLPQIDNESILMAPQGTFGFNGSSAVINVGGKERFLAYKNPNRSDNPNPDNVQVGEDYYNTDKKKKLLYNGTEWTNIDGSVDIDVYGESNNKPARASVGERYYIIDNGMFIPVFAGQVSGGNVLAWFNADGVDIRNVTRIFGTTAQREAMSANLDNHNIGLKFWDTDLYKWCYWLSSRWADERGFTPNITKGTYADAQALVDNNKLKTSDKGYEFFATDKGTAGMPIYYGGNSKWYDAAGNEVSA